MISEREIILRHNTLSSTKSVNGGREYSELIPIDLIIEIFSRLPSKCIARFRCLSKFWASILHRPYFTELFLTRSSSRPQVLFVFMKGNEVFFFSIPQVQNHDEKLSHVIATYVTKTPFRASCERFSNSNGLFFLREEWMPSSLCNHTNLSAVIYNLSTRKSFAIPNFNLKERMKCFLGYDPIEKQYKLLSINSTSTFEVLTIGSGNLLWRDKLCCTKHYPFGDGICIDGVLYYIAMVSNGLGYIMIVSFDIKSEKFNFMKSMHKFSKEVRFVPALINYNGKLGSFRSDYTHYVSGTSKIFEICVLEDSKKQEWSQHIYVLPLSWKDLVGENYLTVAGVIGTDEIVFKVENRPYVCFYVIYYNMKKNSIVKVEIQGMEACKGNEVFAFLNHAENLNFLF